MSNELSLSSNVEWNQKKIELLQQTICKGSTTAEFEVFLHACKRTGLDPFMRQIYSIKRWDSNLKKETMTLQTGIDGYRLIADRSGRFSPGREPTYTYDASGQLVSATAYVKKQTMDGTWHEVSATAFYTEYVQTTKDGNPTSFWKRMPHGQLAKCAEALALRKAFPAELSGIYTAEEMQQADNVTISAQVETIPDLSQEEIDLFYEHFNGDLEMTKRYIKMCMDKRKWNESEAIRNAQKNLERTKEAYDKWKAQQKPEEPQPELEEVK